jgi:hypothetical protein
MQCTAMTPLTLAGRAWTSVRQIRLELVSWLALAHSTGSEYLRLVDLVFACRIGT